MTGSVAGHPLATRQADCAAFMTAAPTPTVPAYASACSGSARYSSACSCWEYTAPTSTCLSPAQATSIVETFASFLTAPQAPSFASQANALLADNFTDTSGSINYLARQNVWSMSFSFVQPRVNLFLGLCRHLPEQTSFHRRAGCTTPDPDFDDT